MRVTVYTKPGCHLCDEALQLLDRMTPRYAIELTEVNILDDMATYEEYKHIIPVIEITEAPIGRLAAPITEAQMRAYLEKARAAVAGHNNGVPVSEPGVGPVAQWIGKHITNKQNG